MEANIFVSNVMNHGNLIHPKLPTAYMSGPYKLQGSGGVNTTYLDFPIPEMSGLTDLFLLTDTTNKGTVQVGSTAYPSPTGVIELIDVNGIPTIRVYRGRGADRASGNWYWDRQGQTVVMTGYILAYIGAERG